MVTIIKIVSSLLGIFPQGLKSLEVLKITGWIGTVQTTALLRSARIVRSDREIWGDRLFHKISVKDNLLKQWWKTHKEKIKIIIIPANLDNRLSQNEQDIQEVIKFSENSMKSCRIELIARGKTLAGTKNQRGIFQRDALSHLVFVLAMVSLKSNTQEMHRQIQTPQIVRKITKCTWRTSNCLLKLKKTKKP